MEGKFSLPKELFCFYITFFGDDAETTFDLSIFVSSVFSPQPVNINILIVTIPINIFFILIL